MPRRKKLDEKRLIMELEDVISGKKEAGKNRIKAILELLKYRIELQSKKQLVREGVTMRVIDKKKLQDLIKFHPHKYQQEVIDCRGKEITICAGRQGGKTILVAYFALEALLEQNQAICLIAPTYGLTSRVMDYLRIWIAKYFKGEMKVSERPFPKITTKWGSYLDGKSAEQPEQILGKGYDLIIVDECARVSEKTHHRYIVPASGVKLGRYFYISTPCGRDWFWKKWRRAKEEGNAFRWRSIDSPYFKKEKWDRAKKQMPEMLFRQEYGAEFLENAIIFQNIDNCIKDFKFPAEYDPNHLYLEGVDLGRYRDFTVITVVDMMTNKLAAFHRFQGDWKLQKKRITSASDKYGKCPIWIDSTSITTGDAFVQQLSDEGYHTTGYKISQNTPKRQLVERLIVLFQNTSLQLPKKGAEELIEELRAFTFIKTPAGIIKYQAPQGEHDDCVMALALNCFDLNETPLEEMKGGHSKVYTFPTQEF